MDVQSALKDLDKHASEFNFPVLDNAYVDMAATRLTAFRSNSAWAIIFEVLGYSSNEGSFVNDLYAFGPSLRKEGFISSNPVMYASKQSPFIDSQTDAWIADWEHWTVVVNGKSYEFAPPRDEYLSQGIEVPVEGGPGSLSEAQIMRFFIYREGAAELFMKEDVLRAELQLSSDMSLLLQTEEWQHPDVAGEEKPSESISLRSLLDALNSNMPVLFQKGRCNTEWKHWVMDAQ